jgi:penicillin V acylase-like amidase (Ntn superfamily)
MCTCFRLTTTDGTIIVGRSMEYALDLASQIRIFPKDIQRSSLAPDGRPGLQWSATYGAVGFDMRGLDFCCDGMNERGLTLHALYMPIYTAYQDAASQEEPEQTDYTQWISIWDLTHLVLYYRSYENLTLRSIDLPQMDLTQDSKQARVQVSAGNPVVDMTAALR